MTTQETTQTDAQDDLRTFLTYRLARLQNRLNAQAIALLRAHSNLSLTEWRIISMLNLMGATTATVISKEADMDKGQISRALKPLVDRGLLREESNPKDHRQTILHLTAEGENSFAQTVQMMKGRQKQLTDGFSEEEQHQLFDFLNRLQKNITIPDG